MSRPSKRVKVTCEGSGSNTATQSHEAGNLNSFPTENVHNLGGDITGSLMSDDATLDSMVYTPFQYVSPYTRHDWNIQARVGQKIVINEHRASKKVKLLLIDSQGWKMEAMMYGGIVVQSGSQISEGKVYFLANVRVQGAPDIFRSVNNNYRFVFTKNTKFKEDHADRNFPAYTYEFMPFGQIRQIVGNRKCLIDVMAFVGQVGDTYHRQFDEQRICRREILLIDRMMQHMKLTLTDNLCSNQVHEWRNASQVPTVIVVTGLIAHEISGHVVLWSSDVSRVLFNPPIAGLDDLKYSVLERRESGTLATVTLDDYKAKIDLSKAVRIQISDYKRLLDSSNTESGLFHLVVTISRLLTRSDVFYYGCLVCNRKLCRSSSGVYKCNMCNVVSDGRFRYLFKVEITDHTGSHDLTIGDRNGTKLFGCTANDLAHAIYDGNPDGLDLISAKISCFQWKQYNLFLTVDSKMTGDDWIPIQRVPRIIGLSVVNPSTEADYLLSKINNLLKA